MAQFEWTNERFLAAQLVADGDLTYPQIAERAGVTRETLLNWRKRPEFASRVEELREDFRQAVKSRGIAIKEKRVESQNSRWRKIHQIINERAVDPAMQGVPGGQTGFVVRQLKSIGSGENTQIVAEYPVDVALLKELRELEKLTAQELGQWTENMKIESAATIVVSGELKTALDRAYNEPTPT